MSFSIIDTVLAGEKEADDNVWADFQFLTDDWKKRNRRRLIPHRQVQIEKEPEQQTQPKPMRPRPKAEERDESDFVSDEAEAVEAEEALEDAETATSGEHINFPIFSLVNQRNFPLLKFERNAKPRPPIPQPVAPQARVITGPQAIGYPARPYPANAYLDPMQRQYQSQQQQAYAQNANTQQDEANRQLAFEAFFITSKQQHAQQQQERRENDNRYLGPVAAGQLRANIGPLIGHTQFRPMAPGGALGRPWPPGLFPGAGLRSDLQQMRMPRSQSGVLRPSAPQEAPPMRIYFNRLAEKSAWNVIWEPSECRNVPLVLDKSDKRFKYTEVHEQRNGERTTIRRWNEMNFEDPLYHCALYVARDSRLNLNIQHSLPALNMSLIEANITDFVNYHKPKFDTEPFLNRKVSVTFEVDAQPADADGETVVSPFLKDLKSLSGRKGNVVVIEHTSESLVFILNVGMASKLITYWHKATPSDNPKTNIDNLHVLDPDQKSPFSAEIPRNELVPSINCHLFSIPLAEHEVRPTDFLLIKSITKMKFYIRRFNQIYCAGYLEPRQIVLRPATKTAQDFHMNFIRAILVNIFRGTEQYPGRRRIQVSQIQQEFFPAVNEPKLRSVLHSFAKFYREQGNGFWERKDVNLDETFQQIEITPEQVCRYQSMLVGQWKLRENGVNILTKSKRVSQQIQNLRGELTKRVAEKIEIELMKTPWARTDNFSKAFQGHALQIEHTEDGEQIVRSKSRRGKSRTADGKESVTQSKRQLAGTRSDLRKLTLAELKELLLELGAQPSEIDGLDRWAQVDLLRSLCTRQKQDGTESDLISNYARGPRNDYAASLDAYKKQYQTTFDNNLLFIRTKSASGTEEQFDDGTILDDISLQMMREDREDEENEDFDMLMPQESKQGEVSKGDPPELVPYGIYVYPTKIEWDKLGFANCPMRTVAKLITISWTREEGLRLDLRWRRSPHQIEMLQKYTSNVYADQGQKAPAQNEDLEEHLLKNARKAILDKIRRTRQAVKTKGPKTPVQSYLAVHHRLPLVNDTGANNLTFKLTLEIIQKIQEASDRFAAFEKRTGRSHAKKKKVVAEHGSDDDSDEAAEVVPARKKRTGRQSPVVLFNDLLKKLLAKLIQRPGDEFWPFKKPVLKKDAPDYYTIISQPMCFESIERKANNLEYKTISRFYADVKQIEANCRRYNSGRNPDLVELGERMMKEFETELANFREELDRQESEIDPVLRSQE